MHVISCTLVAITTIMGTLYRKVFSCTGDGVFASWKPSDIPEGEPLNTHVYTYIPHANILTIILEKKAAQ